MPWRLWLATWCLSTAISTPASGSPCGPRVPGGFGIRPQQLAAGRQQRPPVRPIRQVDGGGRGVRGELRAADGRDRQQGARHLAAACGADPGEGPTAGPAGGQKAGQHLPSLPAAEAEQGSAGVTSSALRGEEGDAPRDKLQVGTVATLCGTS